MFTVQPRTAAAKAWVDENVQVEPWAWFSDRFACDQRYVVDLVHGMRGDGLEVESGPDEL